MTKSPRVHRLSFYATPPHRCSYLPDQESTTLFADPRYPKTNRMYAILSERGFRRSGEHLYQPYCQHCSACIPIRIPVQAFRQRRRHRRTWRQNEDLGINCKPPRFEQEHYDLYCRYLAARHAGGGMDDPSPDSYMNFLTASWADTLFLEMRQDNRLVAVAVTDQMPHALSAVYTFFDPGATRRSLGRYAILQQIELARSSNRQWLYLGYWIEGCRKMRYKTDYQPLEYFHADAWQPQPPAHGG